MRFWGNYFLTNSCLQTRDDLFELLLGYDNAEVRSRGIDLEGLLLQACNQWSLQKALVKALKLKNVTPYFPILRLQDKFDRWRFSERGNIACRRALRCLQHISKHSRPAVVISILRVWFNGWPTARRMRNMPSDEATQRCKLGCQLCGDSIEHYWCCRIFWKFCFSPPSPWYGNFFQAQIKGTIFHGELRFMRERFSEIGSCNPCSAFFLLGASPVEPPSNLNVNKVLMLLIEQTAAGFNASRENFQPSRNATLYDIDTPILSQLGI